MDFENRKQSNVGGGGATVVACGGGQAREACNTPRFLEEPRERREGHWSQQRGKV
jgi:hypothetical protein